MRNRSTDDMHQVRYYCTDGTRNGFIQFNVAPETERKKKRNVDNILERGETTPALDSSEKTIDLDKRLRNISKLLVLGVFLEPVLDFSRISLFPSPH